MCVKYRKDRDVPSQSSTTMRQLEKVNKELLLVFSMFVIALLLELPDRRAAHGALRLHAADGRLRVHLRPAPRHADGIRQRPARCAADDDARALREATRRRRLATHEWLDLVAWGGSPHRDRLLMGTLYEHKNAQLAGAARDLSRRAADPAAPCLQGRVHRTPLPPRVRVRGADCRAPQAEPRADRGRARGRPAARHRQARDQPRAALQGRATDDRRVPGNPAARRQGRGDARNASAVRCAASSRSCWRTTTSSTGRATTRPRARRFRSKRGSSRSPTSTIR